jgi:proteasome beta subunit
LRFSGSGGAYQGSSFCELLEVEHPQVRIGWSELLRGSPAPTVPHGTTVLAFKYADGVIVAGDRLATEGYRVASRDVQKVYATDAHSLIAIAGAAGPAIEMARRMRIELEHYETIEGEALELDGKANKLSQMVRANLPAAMQGLVVVPLFAGYDLRRRAGRIWKFDVTGGRYEEADFDSTGSGGLYAKEALKQLHRSDLSRAEALEIAVSALQNAAEEDRGTGGIDTARRIFPTLLTCSASGIEPAAESEIEAAYQRIVASRNNRNARRGAGA